MSSAGSGSINAASSSSSASSRKRELIDRIRYPNPIPLPPYPPKLVKIPTDPSRYTNAHFSDRLASSHPLPIIVDAHAGMPIDLAQFQDLWEGDLSEVSVGPTERIEQADLDDADAFLLQDFSSALPSVGSTAPGSVGIITSLNAIDDPESAASLAAALQQRQALAIGPSAKTTLAADDVTWLRRTEYLSAEQKRAQQAVQRPRQTETINTSRDAQIKKIEQSFKDAQKPLANLVHPTKRGVKAVSSFELLPDPDTWATDYQVVRFIDPPGRMSNGVPIVDPRLDVALFRPVNINNEQRVSYYLPTGEDLSDDVDVPLALLEDVELEDEKARRLRKRRRTGKFPVANSGEDGAEAGDGAGEGNAARNDYATAFKWVRDYVPKDTASSHDVLLLSLDDGVPDEDPDAEIDPLKSAKRKAGGAEPGNDDDDDADLFGDDDDASDAGQADAADAASTAVPQSQHERQKRSRRSELTKGKERDAAPNGTGATLAFKTKPKAYYHKIGMRFTLRVWRSRVVNNEKLRAKDRRYPGKWDVIMLSHRELTEREQLRRYHIRSQVDDMGALDAYESSADEEEEEEEEGGEVEAEAEGEGEGEGEVNGASESAQLPNGEGDARLATSAAATDEDDDVVQRNSRPAVDADRGRNESDDEAADEADGRADTDGDDENGNDNDETDDEDAGSIDADEELAALRAEAEGAGDEDDAEPGEDESGGGGRRSRRRGAAVGGGVEDGGEERRSETVSQSQLQLEQEQEGGMDGDGMDVDE